MVKSEDVFFFLFSRFRQLFLVRYFKWADGKNLKTVHLTHKKHADTDYNHAGAVFTGITSSIL